MRNILVFFILVFSSGMSLSAQEGRSHTFERKYFEPLTQSESQGIAFIIKTVATKPAVMLLFEKGALDKAGEQIVAVHPLRFWKEAFIRPDLRLKLGQMWGISKGRFIESFGDSFEQMKNMGMIYEEQVLDFSSVTGIPKETLETLIRRSQWSQMINMLFQIAKY